MIGICGRLLIVCSTAAFRALLDELVLLIAAVAVTVTAGGWRKITIFQDLCFHNKADGAQAQDNG